jgi:hypothetical protein
MAYFTLDSDQVQMVGSIEQQAGPPIYRFAKGEPYEPKPERLPFEFSFSEPIGKHLYDLYSGDCLMSVRLIEALQAAGVDNIRIFPATLIENTTGATRDDYRVVNIIGLVAAADLSQSKSIPLGGGHVFTDLKVNEIKARELLMFRLAESLIDVVVHEKVARAVSEGGFNGILLTPVGA